jgi:hypothetical protein
MKNAIVVLSRPRCGSSLLMQTLAILGVSVVGAKYRPDLPVECNPKGFFEDPELIHRGFSRERLIRVGGLEGRAVKIGMPVLTSAPDRDAQWAALVESGARLIIAYRHPLEAALSRNRYARHPVGGRDHFIHVTRFFRHVQEDFRVLAETLTHRMPELRPRTLLVGYHESMEDPVGYVELLRRLVGLDEHDGRIREAVGNIDTGLHRCHAPEIAEAFQRWYAPTPAREIYQIIRSVPRETVWDELARYFHDRGERRKRGRP